MAIAAGDTDGDGVPEVCAAMSATLRVFDLDGNERWTAPRSADGGDSFGQLFRGADGERLSVFSTAGLPKTDETSGPMILDLDGDGSAEILVDGQVEDDGGLQTASVLYALGPASGTWAPTRPAVVLLTDRYGGLREETRVTVAAPIPAGTRSASVEFTVRRPQLGAVQFIEVYAPEARNECNPLDNRVEVPVDPCP